MEFSDISDLDETMDTNGPAAMSVGLPSDVLIVEDDAIIALDFEDTLLRFGVASVRIASNVTQALAMIADGTPDFALLDIGLSREKSFAVAERLAELKVGFAFVTGYSATKAFPPEYSNRPRLSKPFLKEDLLAVLSDWRSGGERRSDA
jgi:DNA-binding NtrC family response regulator